MLLHSLPLLKVAEDGACEFLDREHGVVDVSMFEPPPEPLTPALIGRRMISPQTCDAQTRLPIILTVAGIASDHLLTTHYGSYLAYAPNVFLEKDFTRF